MISIFKEARDADGRTVVEIGMNSMLFQISAITWPLVLIVVAYFAVGTGPQRLPLYLIAGFIVIGAIAYAVAGWMGKRTKVRITIDGKAGKLLVATSDGQSEVHMADVASAGFTAASGESGVYRLEFVMKNGERVPATTTYTNAYSLSVQAKTVALINAALGR